MPLPSQRNLLTFKNPVCPSVKEELRYKYSHMHALLRAGLIIAMAIQMIVRKRSMHKRKDINRDIIL